MLRRETVSKAQGNRKFVAAVATASNGGSSYLWAPPTLPWQLGIAIGGATLLNGTAGTVKAGLAGRLPVSLWVAGQVDSAGAYTADTTDAQDVGAGDFQIHDRADSGSGLLAGAQIPWNVLGIIQSAAGDQTGPTLIVEYWNGSAWTDIAAGLLMNDALIANGTGEKVLCWGIPADWAVGGDGTGVPAATYNIRVRYTTTGAGAADPAASQLFLGVARMLVRTLGTGQAAALIGEDEFFFPPQCDALFGVFSTAGWGNHVEVRCRAY